MLEVDNINQTKTELEKVDGKVAEKQKELIDWHKVKS